MSVSTVHERRAPVWLRFSLSADYFRQQSFLALTILMAAVAWTWLAWKHQHETLQSPLVLIMILALAAVLWIIYRLYRDHYAWAVLIFLVAQFLFITLAMVWTADLTLGYLYLLGILMAGSLIGPAGALITAGIVLGTEIGLVLQLPAHWFGEEKIMALLVQQMLFTLVVWQSSLGLHEALASAEMSARNAQKHAEEARGHRAEVQKALKSLHLAHNQLERAHTELYYARKIADTALRFKREFAAQISHELRTSLNLILGFSETMAFSQQSYGAKLPDAYLRDVTEIHRNSRHLLALIDDVLDLSKLETGRMGLHREPVDINSVVREAVNIIQPLFDANGLTLTLDLSPITPTLSLDRGRIRQILLNLLSNAAQITQEGGVTVRVAVEAGELCVRVCDTGPGIPADELENVFKEFHQLEAQSGRAGLGLAVSKQIVHLHGGRMWAESELGQGSTFAFAFPIAESIVLSPLLGGEPVPPQHQSKALVVAIGEPDSDEVKLLQRHLQDYTVAATPGWESVERAVRRQNARAVIANTPLDALPPLPDLPVPVIASPLPGPHQTARNMNIAHYIQKPVTTAAMQTALQNVAPDAETLLLVDDDPGAVRLIERLLGADGRARRTFRAYSGQEALARLHAQQPDAVVLDLAMPDGDGLWLLSMMSQDAALKQVPVIVVSGCAVEDLWQSGPVGIIHPEGFTATETLNYLQALLSAVPPAALEPDANVPAFAAALPG